jgi:putative addiction module component (TIGR02574 family)
MRSSEDYTPVRASFMAINVESLGLGQLSVAERLELIQRLWESLPPQVEAQEIPSWHREILDERLADADKNPGVGVPWREALSRLETQQ